LNRLVFAIGIGIVAVGVLWSALIEISLRQCEGHFLCVTTDTLGESLPVVALGLLIVLLSIFVGRKQSTTKGGTAN
jgi:hypothetical protein